MSRTVLVLTATGTTGAATVRALLARGATVRAATRNPSASNLPAGAAAVAWSFDDPSTWGPALAGVDALYLATPPFRPSEVADATAIVAAARAAGVARIVKLSAAGVDANPASAHRQVELIVEASGARWIHLRPSFFHENFIEFYGDGIRTHGAIHLPAGSGKTGFIAADDIGAVAAAALLGDASGEAWTLTGPESLDHAEVAAALTATLGRPVAYIDVPPTAFEAGLRGAGMSETAVQSMSELYGLVRAGWTGGLTGTVAEILGREPESIATWARRHAAAWS
jgi:uncharacterized protein YbjT (DUF2867 family)